MNNLIFIIPARLDSSRFPKKILHDIKGLPMVEHVRRRILLSKNVKRVIIATCDEEIKKRLEVYNAEVIMTRRDHINGTSRVAEAIENLSCEKVILVQGDEPLILPSDIDKVFDFIKNDKHSNSWNATSPIENKEELFKPTFVKCSTYQNRVLYCYRKSPNISDFENQIKFSRKILGLIAFRKDFLLELVKSSPTPIEKNESIEQMRIIELGYILNSIPLEKSQYSINEPSDLEDVLNELDNNLIQRKILEKIKSKNKKWIS